MLNNAQTTDWYLYDVLNLPILISSKYAGIGPIPIQIPISVQPCSYLSLVYFTIPNLQVFPHVSNTLM